MQDLISGIFAVAWLVWRRDLDVGRLHAPYIPGVLGDGAVAGELARSCDIPDDLLGPFLWVLQNIQERGAFYIDDFVIKVTKQAHNGRKYVIETG